MRKLIQRALIVALVAVATLAVAVPVSAGSSTDARGSTTPVALVSGANVGDDADPSSPPDAPTPFSCSGYVTLACRWTWNQVLQRSPNGAFGWETLRSNDFCYTCGGSYVADSGRFYGTQRYSFEPPSWFRGATRSTATQAYQVRFYLADGSTVLKNMAVNLCPYQIPG